MEYNLSDLKKTHECCANHVRTWEETKGWTLPPSEHSPKCKNYNLVDYYKADTDVGPVICENLDQMNEVLGSEDGDSPYDYVIVKMTEDQFFNLREFES